MLRIPDKKFDFVVCSHTLEDIRNSIFICSELNRIGKAGYLETPSRLSEQTKGYHGGIGAPHHHWIVDYENSEMAFHSKTASLTGTKRPWVPTSYTCRQNPARWVGWMFWEGAFRYRGSGENEARRKAEDFVRSLRVGRKWYLRHWLGLARYRLLQKLHRTPEPDEAGMMTQEDLDRLIAGQIGNQNRDL